MQVFVVFSLITVLWCVYGYSFAFTEGNAFFGGHSRIFLAGIGDAFKGEWSLGATFSKATPMYEIVFVAFQATFAAITCCLILGSVVERIKFSAVLIFMVIWFTFSYLPVAHMVWFWPGPDAYSDAVESRSAERDRRLHLADGRARFRRRHGRAHQCGCRRPHRCVPRRQAARLRQGSDPPAQPHDDDDRRLAALVRLVRLQRGLGARGERVGLARVPQHLSRDRVRGARLDVRRVDLQGQAVDARRGIRRGRRSRRDHAGGGQRRHSGRVRDRHRRRRDLPCGA